MSILVLACAALGGSNAAAYDAIAMSAPWGDISTTVPANISNAAVTLTFVTGSTRTLLMTFDIGDGSMFYRKNGGASVPISSGATVSISSGDTLLFRITSSDPWSGTMTVTDQTRGTVLDSFTYTVT